MGEVLPFTGRFFAVRDWTASERAQIQTLARQLKAQAADVEVVYGASDAGDPWCVIKDGQENVLIHVARIGGGVVIHDMVADLVKEGRDLWFALGRAISDENAPIPHEATAIDPVLERRNAQLVLALVTATAFGMDPDAVFDTAAAPETGVELPAAASDEIDVHMLSSSATPAAAAESPLAHDPTLAAMDMAVSHANPIDESGAAGRVTVDPPSPPHAAVAPSAASAALNVEVAEAESIAAPTAPQTITGTAGNDTLQGTSAAEVIRGGPGDDVISGGGAPQGQVDVLDGGSGDDQISVDAEVVAAGGSGADTFVVAPPTTSGVASTNLGVIIDFDQLDGDKLKIDTARQVTITSVTEVDNILADAAGSTTLSGASPVPGERVGVDVDGDGVEDGYVMIAVVRGKVALGAAEQGDTLSGAHGEHTFYASEVLNIGASIWIDSSVI